MDRGLKLKDFRIDESSAKVSSGNNEKSGRAFNFPNLQSFSFDFGNKKEQSDILKQEEIKLLSSEISYTDFTQKFFEIEDKLDQLDNEGIANFIEYFKSNDIQFNDVYSLIFVVIKKNPQKTRLYAKLFSALIEFSNSSPDPIYITQRNQYFMSHLLKIGRFDYDAISGSQSHPICDFLRPSDIGLPLSTFSKYPSSFMHVSNVSVDKFNENRDKYIDSLMKCGYFDENSPVAVVKYDNVEKLKQIVSDDESILKSNQFFISPLDHDAGSQSCDFMGATKISLLAVSAYYGARECFRFLKNSSNEPLNSYIKYVLCGGSTEIFDMAVEGTSDLSINIDKAVEYHRYSLIDHIFTLYKESGLKDLSYDADVATSSGNVKMLHFYKELGKPVFNKLNDAISNGHKYVLKMYLNQSSTTPNPEEDADEENEEEHLSNESIRSCFSSRNTIILDTLLEAGVCITKDSAAGSLIISALTQPIDKEYINFLLKYGYSIDYEDGLKMTPLHHAVIEGDKGLVEFILGYGANPNKKSYVNHLSTPFHLVFNKQTTPNSLEIAQILIDHGANINMADGGLAAIHMAATNGDVEALTFLLDRGAKIDIPSSVGKYTPIALAVLHYKLDAVKLLIKRGAQLKTLHPALIDIKTQSFNYSVKHTLVDIASSEPLKLLLKKAIVKKLTDQELDNLIEEANKVKPANSKSADSSPTLTTQEAGQPSAVQPQNGLKLFGIAGNYSAPPQIPTKRALDCETSWGPVYCDYSDE